MKRLVLGFLALMFVGFTATAGTSKYDLNEEAVEAAFSIATEISVGPLNSEEFNVLGQMSYGDMTQIKGSKNSWVAFALAWFVGGLGIHRMYLGSATGVYIGYILTCGGLGIVSFIDWIILLVDAIGGGAKIDDYTDNPAFFMW